MSRAMTTPTMPVGGSRSWDRVNRSIPIDFSSSVLMCSEGCRGTTGPNSIDPASEKRYGADFPTVTVGDMVRVQAMLLDPSGHRAGTGRSRRFARRFSGARVGDETQRSN